eukprot:jgi/Undpi1/8621/HiC_scaffold_25.g11086.m1
MNSVFEPSPGDDHDQNPEDGHGFVGGGEEGGGGLETEAGFSVLGTGRFSKVVWAKRRQRWAMGGSGASVCAVKGEGSRCKSEPDLSFESCSEFGSENGSEFGSERGSEYGSDTNSASDTEGIFYIEDSSWEPSARRYTSDGDGDGGGGVVRLHSILETANELR